MGESNDQGHGKRQGHSGRKECIYTYLMHPLWKAGDFRHGGLVTMVSQEGSTHQGVACLRDER